MPTGDSLAYLGGTTHRPIPTFDPHARKLAPAHTHKPKPTGLDFDALVRRCSVCGERKPGRLTNGACASCAPLLPTPVPAPAAPSAAQGRAKRKGGARKGKPASPSRAKPTWSTYDRPARRKSVDEPAIVREYLAGDSLRAVGARHGIHGGRVRDIVTNHGHPIRESRWTPDQVEQILKRYADGEPTTSLGLAFNANAGTIGNLLRANGITLRPPASSGRDVTPHDVVRATELYQRGAALAAIAETLHISRDRIRVALLNAGVELRPAGGPERVGYVRGRATTAAIRAWAHEQGLLDPDTKTGRLPKAVLSAYTQAHPTHQEEGTNA